MCVLDGITGSEKTTRGRGKEETGSDSDCLCGDGWECMSQNNKHCVGLGGLSEQVLSIGTGLWHQNRIRIWIWGYCALPSTCRPPGQKATKGEVKEKKGTGKAILLQRIHSSVHPLSKSDGRRSFFPFKDPLPHISLWVIKSFSALFSYIHSHKLYAYLNILWTNWRQIPWRYMEKVRNRLWLIYSVFAWSRNENKVPSCCISYKDSGRHLLTKRPLAPFQSLVIRHTRPARDPYRWGDDVRVLQTEPDWILSQAWWLISAQCFWPPTQTAPLSLCCPIPLPPTAGSSKCTCRFYCPKAIRYCLSSQHRPVQHSVSSC